MIDPRTILVALALSVAVAALVVAARFVWCLVEALQARRYLIVAAAVAGVVSILALLSAVVVVWFGYAVAHTGKNARTDLIVFISTVPPYFLLSIGLWLLGGRLYRRVRRPVAQQEAAGATEKRQD